MAWLGVLAIAVGLYELFQGNWLSTSQFLLVGVALVMGLTRPGPRQLPAIILFAAGMIMFFIRVALNQ